LHFLINPEAEEQSFKIDLGLIALCLKQKTN
jgi:hypothetical protein